MINLNVEEYCHECERFSPKVNTFYADGRVFTHVIECAYSLDCRRIRLFIEKKLKEKENESISE